MVFMTRYFLGLLITSLIKYEFHYPPCAIPVNFDGQLAADRSSIPQPDALDC